MPEDLIDFCSIFIYYAVFNGCSFQQDKIWQCLHIYDHVFKNSKTFLCFQKNQIGTGAGHGATGGSPSSTVAGGVVYDNTRFPTEAGSGGGNSASGTGGSGGGYLKLFLYSSLTIDGMLLCYCD